MTANLPTGLLSPARAAAVHEGADAAALLVNAIFPPRTDDPDGSLALSAVEVLTNRTLRAELANRDTGQARQWWLEGFVLGYCRTAVHALAAACELADDDPAVRLDDMERHVLGRLTAHGGAQVDASGVVFALCRSLLDVDDLAALWALENLWRPSTPAACDDTDAVDAHPAGPLFARVRQVLSAAAMTMCACWTLLIFADEDARPTLEPPYRFD